MSDGLKAEPVFFVAHTVMGLKSNPSVKPFPLDCCPRNPQVIVTEKLRGHQLWVAYSTSYMLSRGVSPALLLLSWLRLIMAPARERYDRVASLLFNVCVQVRFIELCYFTRSNRLHFQSGLEALLIYVAHLSCVLENANPRCLCGSISLGASPVPLRCKQYGLPAVVGMLKGLEVSASEFWLVSLGDKILIIPSSRSLLILGPVKQCEAVWCHQEDQYKQAALF